jgi:hypothetical protein
MKKAEVACLERLKKEYPELSISELAWRVNRLFFYGRKIQKISENECNGVFKGYYPNGHIEMGWDEKDQERADKATDKIRLAIEKMGFKVSRLGGDPRGCCLQLALPSGYVDGWGQEGFCIEY